MRWSYLEINASVFGSLLTNDSSLGFEVSPGFVVMRLLVSIKGSGVFVALVEHELVLCAILLKQVESKAARLHSRALHVVSHHFVELV